MTTIYKASCAHNTTKQLSKYIKKTIRSRNILNLLAATQCVNSALVRVITLETKPVFIEMLSKYTLIKVNKAMTKNYESMGYGI